MLPGRTFVPIRPANEKPEDHGLDEPHTSRAPLPPRKKQTPMACENCRRHKVKCDGKRPKCSKCLTAEIECTYDSLPGESRVSSLKRKHDEALSNAGDLMELFTMLRHRSEPEAFDIFRRLRGGTDPKDLLKYVHEADYLLQGFAAQSSPRHALATPIRSTAEQLLSSLFKNAFPALSYRQMLNDYPDLSYQATIFDQMELKYRYVRLGTFASATTSSKSSRSSTDRDQLGNDEGDLVHPRFGGPVKDDMQQSDFSDVRLMASRGSRWTQVIKDERLICGLISWFLSWYQAPLHFVDTEAFIDDFVSGEERFCSSALVNAMLALASLTGAPLHYSSERLEVSQLSKSFAAEAYYRLERVHERDTLTCFTTIPALLILSLVENCNGRDRVGWSRTSKCVELAQNCELLTKENLVAPPHVNKEHWKTSFAVISWSLYSWAALQSFTLQKRPLLKRYPLVKLPYEDVEIKANTDHWQPFPLVRAATPKRFGLSFRSFCDFAIILNDISWLLYSTESVISIDATEISQLSVQLRRLMYWSVSLPTAIADSFNALPHVMLLHFIYHVAILDVLRPLIKSDTSLEIHGIGTLRPSAVFDASLRQLKVLSFLYTSKYGYRIFHCTLLLPLVYICNAALSEAAPPSNAPDARYLFFLCIAAMEAMALRISMARVFQASLLLSATKDGIKLSSQVKAILRGLRDDAISSKFAAFAPYSDHPIDLNMCPIDRAACRCNIKKLVSELSQLELDSDPEEQPEAEAEAEPSPATTTTTSGTHG